MDSLFEFIYGFVDFLAVSDTKLESSFPTGFSTPYRTDLFGKSGGLLVYVNGNIPSNVLKACPINNQVIFIFQNIEMNLKKLIWLVVVIYTPPSQCKNYFITELTKILDKYR